MIASYNQVGGSSSIPDTCSGDGWFTITANAAPNLDGCFVDTEEDRPDGSLAYTVTGTTGNAEIVVFSLVADDGDVSLRVCWLMTILSVWFYLVPLDICRVSIQPYVSV